MTESQEELGFGGTPIRRDIPGEIETTDQGFRYLGWQFNRVTGGGAEFISPDKQRLMVDAGTLARIFWILSPKHNNPGAYLEALDFQTGFRLAQQGQTEQQNS